MQLEKFLMVDRLVAVTEDQITVTAQVPDASPVFEGHFPGHPLVPGVLLVETMAQASGYLLLHRTGFARMPFLAAVREAKLRGFVAPGTELTVEAELRHDGSGFAVTAGRISVAGRRIGDAELTLRTLPFPTPEVEAAIRERAGLIGLAVPA